MSLYSEQQQLMAEFENREKRPRGARSGKPDENGALAELARFVDAQKNRCEESRELPGRPVAEIWQESSNPAERAGSHARKRNVGDDSAPIDAALARASGFRNSNARSEPLEEAFDRRAVDLGYGAAARRRLLYFMALIVVIGVVGLTASSVSWRKLSNPTETALIGRETRGTEPQPEKLTDANLPAQNASIVDARPADASPHDLGYVLAPIEEAATRPKLLFDQAPPLNLDSSSEPPKISEVEKVSRVEKEAKSRVNESTSNCLVKVDGRILINRSCQVSWTKQQRVTFELAEKPLTISYDHGRTWLATLGSQELGKVYKTGSCWGSKRAYVCEHNK